MRRQREIGTLRRGRHAMKYFVTSELQQLDGIKPLYFVARIGGVELWALYKTLVA